MPEKDLGFLMTLYNTFREQGIAMSIVFVLTAFRMYKEDNKPSFKNIFIESSVGALAVYSVGLTCKEFGMSQGWAFAVSGFIGIFGIETFKYYLRKLADKRVEKK